MAEAVRHLTEQRLGSVILVTAPNEPEEGKPSGSSSSDESKPAESAGQGEHVTAMLTARDLLRAIASSLPPLPPSHEESTTLAATRSNVTNRALATALL